MEISNSNFKIRNHGHRKNLSDCDCRKEDMQRFSKGTTNASVRGRKFRGEHSLIRLERWLPRLSPCERGEDKGEGFGGTCAESTLTLPLQKGEATQAARGYSKNSWQT